MSTFEERIDKVREYFKEHKAERYPFENTALSEKDEYIKSLYFRMLCTLIRYTGEASEMQVLYVKRLIAGCKGEREFQDYMKMALDLDISDVEEFISVFREDGLRYYFCIDGAILLSAAETEEKKYELLAELIETLGITHGELKYLAAVAQAVVLQSSEKFDEAKTFVPDTLCPLSMYHYVQGFYAGAIVDTPNEIHIFSCDRSEVDLSAYGVLKNKKVIIENISCSLKGNVILEGCAEVIIRNCKFMGSQYHFEFNTIGNVVIENCDVRDFTNRFAYFTDTNNFTVLNNRFLNCGCTTIGDSSIYGGILYNSGRCTRNIILENNELLNCYIARTEQKFYLYASGIFLHIEWWTNIEVKVLRNHFSGCECRKNGQWREVYISGGGDSRSKTEEGNVCTGAVQRIYE